MILLINICEESLHHYEFVKPIEDILEEQETNIVHYKDLKNSDLEKSEKVIICGTSLKDMKYLDNIEKFSWIKEFEKPVLGICGGMQIIGLNFEGNISEDIEIGLKNEELVGEIFENKEHEVYHLHQKVISLPKAFEKLDKNSQYPVAFKHKEKPIYGVLFHPEVRQKEIISKFAIKKNL